MRSGGLACGHLGAACAAALFLQCTWGDYEGGASSTGLGGASGVSTSESASTTVGQPTVGAGAGGQGAGGSTSCGNPCVLAEGEQPFLITVYEGDVYWTEGFTGLGGLKKCSVSGRGGTPIPLWQGGIILGLAVDQSGVYWLTGSGSLMTCPVGDACNTTVLPVGLVQPRGLALDQDNLYWTEAGQVRTCAKSNCNPISLSTNQVNPGWVVSNGPDVYWSDATANGIKRCAKAGCSDTPTVVVSGSSGFFAADPYDLFWTSLDAVRRCSLGGAVPCDLTNFVAQGQEKALGITMDALTVFWVDSDAGQVLACPKAGCVGGEPTVLASGLDGPGLIAVDNDSFGSVYVSETAGGRVLRISKQIQ